MDRLIREGAAEAAVPIQHEVNGIIEQLCGCRGNMYAVIKEVLRINEGLQLGSVRAPLPGLVPEDLPKAAAAAERIRNAVKRYA